MVVVNKKADSDFKCMACERYIKGKMQWIKRIIQLGVCEKCYKKEQKGKLA